MKQARIAIFASGQGTNARKIIEHFLHHPNVEVALILTNNPKSGVLKLANEFNVKSYTFTRDEFYQTKSIIDLLSKHAITHIVLAGFLWLVPSNLISAYKDRIVNIHPALLPKYGGKGMYGINVHKAVKEAGELVTGITIHLVNENYDEGRWLTQEKVKLSGNDDVDKIALKVQELEHFFYPKVIEKWLIESYLTRVV